MPRTWRKVSDKLETSDEEVVEMSFGQFAELVGDLPISELQDPDWWSNAPGKAQSKAWRKAGYRVDKVDVARGKVRFKRA